MADPVVGSILGGKYLVEGILGQGGMGIVVAARHIELDQRVAIKCLLAHAQSVPEIVERFTREARAAAKIHGEHVARVIDVGRFDDGTPFMVMEHLKGHDLADELAKVGPLPVTDAVRYLLETCEALVQAHALRIVHRDLKPSNLFLAEQPGRRPIVKVLDFGISKVIDPSGGALTKTASVMGTPYYMSPEQLLSSKSVDERSDIWALGIILYELLVGRPPFMAETAPEVIAAVLQNAPAPIQTLRPDVPAGVAQVITRCMRSNVAERYANVAELAQDLVPFAAHEDQDSATAIARVLGVSAPAPSVLPQLAGQQPPTQSARRSGPPANPVANAGTAHNLTFSAADASIPAKKPVGAIVAAVGVLAAIGVASLVAMRRPAPPSAASPGVVESTPAAVVAPAAPGATAGPSQPQALVGLAPVDPPVPAVVASARTSPSSQPVTRGPNRRAAPAAASAHSAAPPAAAAPAPAPPPAAAAPAPRPPAPPPPSNPLDMQIK
jgi:eukaryotic-like serine/threonine-protein kinase